MMKVGKNAAENWRLLDGSAPNDLWFHLESFPSPYVFLTGNPTQEEIEEAARVCKENTKYKNVPGIQVMYTPVANVIKGEKVGEVIIKSHRKVRKIKP